MMPSWLLFFVFALCVLGSSATLLEVPSAIQNGYYPGRSGQMVLWPTGEGFKEPETLVLIIDEQGQYLQSSAPLSSESSAQDTIQSDEVNELATRFLGLISNRPSFSKANVVAGNLFRKPQGLLLLAVDGVGADTIKKFYLPDVHSFHGDKKLFNVRGQSYPFSSLATFTSFVTGSVPSQHGIVGSHWVELRDDSSHEAVSAFEPATTRHAGVATLSDILSQSFAGQSLVFAASANSQFASAAGAHASLVRSAPHWNAISIGYDSMAASFVSLLPRSVPAGLLLPSQAQLLESFTQGSSAFGSLLTSFTRKGGVISYAANKWSVTIAGARKSAEFDMSREADFLFFAELALFSSITNAFRTDANLHALIADSTPDFISLTFSTMPLLAAAYGTAHPVYLAALALLDSVLPQIVQEFNVLYSNQLVAEVAFLGGPPASQLQLVDKQLIGKLRRVLKGDLSRTATDLFESRLPSIYLKLNNDGGVNDGLCRSVNNVINSLGLEAFCPQSRMSREAHLELGFDILEVSSCNNCSAINCSKTTNTSDCYAACCSVKSQPFTDEQIYGYQIYYWTWVLIILLIAMVLVMMFNMELERDSLLYASSKPKDS